jgi:glycosyltransferase involved in cell wall biosynthesis
MRYASVTYTQSPDFNSPVSWLKRIEAYMGILESLAEKNTVFHISQINYNGEYFHNGVQNYFLNFNKKKTLFPLRLNRFVKKLDADIVIVQGLHNPVQLVLLKLILDKKTKIIVHHHAEKPMPGIKKYAQRLADHFVDAYLFASKELGLHWVQQGVMPTAGKIHEVMEVSSNFHPIDKAAAKQQTGMTGDPAFLWVGRLNENKDPLNVVKAFLKYAKVNPAARLYMIYHTDELLGIIKAMLNIYAGKNAVVLIGQVPHADLQLWFNSADYFISGSHYEGSGTAVCEAMSCGCVPVVTDIAAFRMITNNGKCGLLYEAGNEAALLSALKQLNISDLAKKRELCLSYFRERLSFHAIAVRISEIAKSL